MKGGLKIEQVLELQLGGRALKSTVIARKFGMRFATATGVIRKLD